MTTYSGHLLTARKGKQPVCTSKTLTILPGSAFNIAADKNEKHLLAGGFPANHPDSEILLSPTLQLNADLGDFSSEEITNLARAELKRLTNQSYRSYVQDADPRLTVLSADAASLHTFIDTYGGVLQIDAILTKGYDPAFTTGHEVKITQNSNGLLLHFSVKQPVDFNRCSYCGDCGAACPENCLSEELFLDFNRCTLCQKCTDACSREAIDLHLVEERELHTPALLPLEGAGVTLPDSKKCIYSENNLSAFFKRIYASEVEEIIHWNAGSCQYSARLGYGCQLCVDACNHQALQQNRTGVELDHSACIECGACLAACPTGALQYQRFTDKNFIEYFTDFPLRPGSTVILGDESSLHKFWWYSEKRDYPNAFFMEFPQPAALHTMHLLLLFAQGAAKIIILTEDKGNIPKQITSSKQILQTLFDREQDLQLISDITDLPSLLTQNNGTPLTTTFLPASTYINRREKLLKIIQFLSGSNTAAEDIPDPASEDFATVSCDETKCTGCIACVGECRIGALSTDGKDYSLSHTPALCVRCGICVTICPENALSIQPGLSLTNDFFSKQLLAQTEPAKRKGCGKIFGTRKSLEKVVAILSARGMWDRTDDLLEYCENCRVINLYKSSEHERANRID